MMRWKFSYYENTVNMFLGNNASWALPKTFLVLWKEERISCFGFSHALNLWFSEIIVKAVVEAYIHRGQQL
jgi:hypothetical protein